MKKVLLMGLVFAAGFAPVPVVHAQEGHDAVDCVSEHHSRQRCEVPWRDARLVRQLSDTTCVRGENWGIDRDGLWVDRGCSGRFVAAGRDHDRDERYSDRDRHDDDRAWHPEPGWDRRFAVSCESQDGQNHFCQVDLGGGGRASLEQQLSKTPCIEGQTWGSNRAGIWVSQGCRGVFTVDRRWR